MQALKHFRRALSTVREHPRIFANPPETPKPIELSEESKKTLQSLDNQDYYCILELYSRPYVVSKNDIIVANRMDLKIGDEIEFDRLREVGNDSFVLRGNPFIPNYFKVKAVVLEHAKSKDIERKHWKKSGLAYSVTNQTHHTLLRIKDIQLNKDLIK